MARMSRFVILLSGDLTITARLRQQIADARVIAADSGMKHASALGIVPELWVGDFDSAGSELQIDYALVPRQTYPKEKDKTDGEIAVYEAIRLGATEIIMLGGLGGQADHATSHLGLALSLLQSGLKCLLTNGDEEAHPLLAGNHDYDFGAQWVFSIVPWGEIKGLDITGVKWPLKSQTTTLGSSFTMSNVALGPIKISLASGIGILFAYPA